MATYLCPYNRDIRIQNKYWNNILPVLAFAILEKVTIREDDILEYNIICRQPLYYFAVNNMESPFGAISNSICTLYLEPVLNTYYKSYQNILTVNNIPDGPLASLIQRLNAQRLSTFKGMSSQTCLFAICRYPMHNIKLEDNFMYASDIPNVIGYLETNGYHIMTDMTKMAYKMPVDFAESATSYNNRKIVLMFKYEGKLIS